MSDNRTYGLTDAFRDSDRVGKAYIIFLISMIVICALAGVIVPVIVLTQ